MKVRRRFDSLQEWKDEKAARGVSHEFVWNKEQFDAVNPDDTDYLFGTWFYVTNIMVKTSFILNMQFQLEIALS